MSLIGDVSTLAAPSTPPPTSLGRQAVCSVPPTAERACKIDHIDISFALFWAARRHDSLRATSVFDDTVYHRGCFGDRQFYLT